MINAVAGFQAASCTSMVELLPGDQVYINSPWPQQPLVRGDSYSGFSGVLLYLLKSELLIAMLLLSEKKLKRSYENNITIF